ncbi:MAG: ribonuclease H-like domain-containing protein [Candidatus Liptonbacteria bacterium]
MKTLVFDIETANFFTDPDVGWNNFARLRISGVGIYEYEADRYSYFEENELAAAAEHFRNAETLVGFSMNRYDIPVLNYHFERLKAGINLFEKERVDLLDKIEFVTGRRISLSRLAEANLGEIKKGHGSQAIKMYDERRFEELKEYCLKDVELTKRLYDIYLERGMFYIPDKETGEMKEIYFAKQNSADTNSS